MEDSGSVHREPVRQPLRWPERVWVGLALLLIIGGAVLFGLRQWVRHWSTAGITHTIMKELEPADRIEAEPGLLRDFNVVIITSDTTRADHLGCYGNRSIATPVLDGLASGGILFAQAVTPTPSTLPGHSSLLTGLYPHRHGARANGTFRVDEEVVTLAERLKDKGYRTGAVISAFVLDSRFGLDQGFELYDDDLTKGMQQSPHMFRERPAELTNEPATEWLRANAAEPFFLWVHYFDPHASYLPPEPFRGQYANDLYDGEIAYVDSQIGVLLEQLEALGVRDKTLVVYTSDHGEGLGEHGEQSHSMLVYDATLHVPLIFNAPSRLPKGRAVERQACLVDVVPTVLSLLGEPAPGGLDGIDLTRPPVGPTRPVLIETIATMTLHGWAPLVGVRRDDVKYILAPTPELYDLQADPRELNNLHDERPETVRALTGQLAAWLGDDPFLAARGALDLTNMQMDDDALRHLQALGYVSSSRRRVEKPEAMPDPKDMIKHWETVQEAILKRVLGLPRETIATLEQCLAEVPGDVFARSVLAAAYHQMGEAELALEHYSKAVEAEPNNEQLRLSIAGVHLSERRLDEAEKYIAEALAVEPEIAQAYLLRGEIALHRHKEEEALALYRKALEMDPGSAGANANNHMGMLHLLAGRLDEARQAYLDALKIDALNGAAHDGLAQILNQEGKEDEAMAQLQIALRFNPNQPRAMTTLASLVSQRGNQDQALAICLRALDMAPKMSPGHNNLGLIYRRMGNLDLAEEHYLKAIEYDPHLGAAHVNLAQLYTRQGKTEEALEQFQRAVQANLLHPNAIALGNLGVHYFNQGEHKKALALYQRALVSDPDYTQVHRHIAFAYTLPAFDRPDLTAHHLRRSLELDPEQAEAPQMRELLKRAEEEIARREEREGDIGIE